MDVDTDYSTRQLRYQVVSYMVDETEALYPKFKEYVSVGFALEARVANPFQ